MGDFDTDLSKEETARILDEAERNIDSIGKRFDRMKELQKQGKQDSQEYTDIIQSFLDD